MWVAVGLAEDVVVVVTVEVCVRVDADRESGDREGVGDREGEAERVLAVAVWVAAEAVRVARPDHVAVAVRVWVGDSEGVAVVEAERADSVWVSEGVRDERVRVAVGAERLGVGGDGVGVEQDVDWESEGVTVAGDGDGSYDGVWERLGVSVREELTLRLRVGLRKWVHVRVSVDEGEAVAVHVTVRVCLNVGVAVAEGFILQDRVTEEAEYVGVGLPEGRERVGDGEGVAEAESVWVAVAEGLCEGEEEQGDGV